MKSALPNLIIGLSFLLGGVAAAESQQQAVLLLERMSHSMHEQSYDGVFVYNHGAEMGAVRIIHLVKNGEERQRIMHLDGKPRELILKAHNINCVHPGDQMLRAPLAKPVSSASHSYAPGHSGQLTRHYAFELAGSSRVAGRKAVKLAIKPRDQQRLGYRLYLDKQSDLLLKSVTLDVNEEELESFQFTQIKIGDIVQEDALRPESNSATVSDYHSFSHAAKDIPSIEDALWQASWVPDGFAMADDESDKFAHAAVDALHYTDGLAMFSIFIEPAKNTEAVIQQRKGSTVVYSENKRSGDDLNTVTVVGEIPMATAKKIVRGVRPNMHTAQ